MTSQITSNIIRVASVPSDQIYIRHLESCTGQPRPQILRLPDPVPARGPRSEQSPWWPPVMLSAQWVRDHHDSFDLMHVHFGFDALDPQQLRETLAELRRWGKPLVYTVHDLINPHQPDSAAHLALLDVLITGANELITLTDGAAAAISAQWGRQAHVLPHPHVLDFDVMERIRQSRQKQRAQDPQRLRRVGVHLKGLRANISPAILEPLARIVAEIPNAVLQVNIHRQVLDPDSGEYREELARELAHGQLQGKWELVSHEYFSHDELCEYFASLDVNVLPYRFGTHSGWLEAALDAGTAVVVPLCGQYAGQHPSLAAYRWNADRVEEESLRAAVRRQLAMDFIPGMGATERQEQREALAEAHQRIYATLLGRRKPLPKTGSHAAGAR